MEYKRGIPLEFKEIGVIDNTTIEWSPSLNHLVVRLGDDHACSMAISEDDIIYVIGSARTLKPYPKYIREMFIAHELTDELRECVLLYTDARLDHHSYVKEDWL